MIPANLPRGFATLGNAMAANGYLTAAVGKVYVACYYHSCYYYHTNIQNTTTKILLQIIVIRVLIILILMLHNTNNTKYYSD